MADSPEPERELDGAAARDAVADAFEKAKANLSRGGAMGGSTDSPTASGNEPALCQSCEKKPATCFGIYEVNFDEPPTLCCDDCCGHGGEDGWCKPIAEYAAWMDAAFKELAELRERAGILKEMLDTNQAAEARCCPEDVGFEEYIGALQRQLKMADEAERTLRSLATMLGWVNVPPREILEREIAALKSRTSVLNAAPPQTVVQRDGKTRYLLGPFEDPADGPKVLMSLRTALDDLRSRYEDTDCTEAGDELTYRVVEMTVAEVEALPEL